MKKVKYRILTGIADLLVVFITGPLLYVDGIAVFVMTGLKSGTAHSRYGYRHSNRICPVYELPWPGKETE